MEKYNRVSRMVAEITARHDAANLAELIGSIGVEGVESDIRGGGFSFPEKTLIDRVRQFYEESFEIVPAVAVLIGSGRIDAIGDLIDRSQRNAESMLGNQVEETVHLQRSARALGAIAASAFGAGFGGSVYALVRSTDADAFLNDWREEYRARFPILASNFFLSRITQ